MPAANSKTYSIVIRRCDPLTAARHQEKKKLVVTVSVPPVAGQQVQYNGDNQPWEILKVTETETLVSDCIMKRSLLPR